MRLRFKRWMRRFEFAWRRPPELEELARDEERLRFLCVMLGPTAGAALKKRQKAYARFFDKLFCGDAVTGDESTRTVVDAYLPAAMAAAYGRAARCFEADQGKSYVAVRGELESVCSSPTREGLAEHLTRRSLLVDRQLIERQLDEVHFIQMLWERSDVTENEVKQANERRRFLAEAGRSVFETA
jgi:hypothetical protein